MIVGLGHAARVGKDTCAAILVEHHGFERVAFADALRDFVYRTDRDVRLLVDLHGWDDAKVTFPKVRRNLVVVGNEARNIMGEDVWINAAFRRVEQVPHAVIPDVRYPNEVDAVREAGGVVVKIERPGVEPLHNVADQALARFDDWDAVIVNDGTPADLRRKLDELFPTTTERESA